jgi:hypothetical protein
MSGNGGTAGLWINMLGLGPLMATINDPKFQEHIHGVLAMIRESHARLARIEARQNELAEWLHQYFGEVEVEQYGRDDNPVIIARLPAGNGSNGAGAHPVAGGAADHGDSGPSPTYRSTGPDL